MKGISQYSRFDIFGVNFWFMAHSPHSYLESFDFEEVGLAGVKNRASSPPSKNFLVPPWNKVPPWPSVKDNVLWKAIFGGNSLLWKTIFVGRQLLMEDELRYAVRYTWEYHKVPETYLRYTEICLQTAKDIFLQYALSFTWDMSEILLKSSWDIPEISLK